MLLCLLGAKATWLWKMRWASRSNQACEDHGDFVAEISDIEVADTRS